MQSTAQNMMPSKLPAAVGGLCFLSCLLPPDIFALRVLGRYSLVRAVGQLCALLTKETDSKACLIFTGATAGPSALPFHHWGRVTPLFSGMECKIQQSDTEIVAFVVKLHL